MLVPFFYALRAAGIPVSLTELLSLLEALKQRIAFLSAEEFYFLSRMALVKDERNFDRFDRVFASQFAGAEMTFEKIMATIPEEWLRSLGERLMSEEDKQKVQSLGGWEKLLQTLRERLKEQQGRHEGGNKWIGTRGTSPFGADGFNPEGVRIGQKSSRHRRAIKVWDEREFRNLDDSVELGTRNFKMALRRLRHFAREGAADELDLDDTIRSTARNAGWLDLKMVPERRNAVKVLLLLDNGGSMDDHIKVCEELFSAARSEFKNLEHYYFHNCIYEWLWKDNRRRHAERISTTQLINRFNADWRVVIVGDAYMSPYEVMYPGGSSEYWNSESGEAWLRRIAGRFPRLVWLNPIPANSWANGASIQLIKKLVSNRMFPLTMGGITNAMRELRRREVRPEPESEPDPEPAR
jgi:uncharacterized protein with von Willebrand factor type A (vWA) domain